MVVSFEHEHYRFRVLLNAGGLTLAITNQLRQGSNELSPLSRAKPDMSYMTSQLLLPGPRSSPWPRRWLYFAASCRAGRCDYSQSVAYLESVTFPAAGSIHSPRCRSVSA